MRHNPTVIITGPRQVGLRDEPIPSPGEGEVLVETICSGISAGTELNVYRGVAPQWRRRQDRESHLFVPDEPEWTYPLVYGYANVGTVAAAGPGARSRWWARRSSAISRTAPGTWSRSRTWSCCRRLPTSAAASSTRI